MPHADASSPQRNIYDSSLHIYGEKANLAFVLKKFNWSQFQDRATLSPMIKNMLMNLYKIMIERGRLVVYALLIGWLMLSQAGAQWGGRGGGGQENQVVVKPASGRIINDRLTAIGTGQAQMSVAITPWSSGKLERVFVVAGERVKAGQVIAELDRDNEVIMLERARIELEDAIGAVERLTRLRDSDTASRVQLINAELALTRARLNVRDSELALERRSVLAPIDGIVGILAVDAGNYVTASSVLARLDNRDKILIDVFLPERFVSQITTGQEVTARAIARGGELFHGHISAIDNALDEASRTLRVRAEIINEGDKLRAGMSFAVTFTFAGERFVSVDPLAIQWRSEGAYVWRVDEDMRAVRVPVSIVQRGSDYVLVSGDLQENQLVVIQGVHHVRENMPVKIKDLPDLDIEGETVSSIAQP